MNDSLIPSATAFRDASVARGAVLLLVVGALLAVACRSSDDRGAADDVSTSDVDATEPVSNNVESESPARVVGLEGSSGPASILATITAVLPEEADLGGRWSWSPAPYIEKPEGCDQLVPVAASERGFVETTEESVVLRQLTFGVAAFNTEEEATRFLSQVNGGVADTCDVLLLPQFEAAVSRQSAGVYSVDSDSVVGFEVEPPSETVEAARRYDLDYLGSAAPLDINLELLFVQRGHYLVTVSRGSSGDAELDPVGLTELERIVGAVEALPEPTRDPALDRAGELLRHAVPADLVPERFELHATAELRQAAEKTMCDDPDHTVVELELDGPVWFALSARSGEQLALEALAFETPQNALDYLTVVSATGADCLSSFEPWPEPRFSRPVASEETRAIDDIEVTTLRVVAVQELADLEVEVEAVVHLARHDRFVATVQWAGLAGDGDAALEMVLEMTRRFDS